MTSPLRVKNIIATAKSHLDVYSFDDISLLEACISETDSLLRLSHDRYVGWFSDRSGNYRFGHLVSFKTYPLTPSVRKLLNTLNRLFHTDGNGILINRYNDGNQFIGRHRDSKNHTDIGVIILSYGSPRTFRIYNNDGQLVESVVLNTGDMLHMGGAFQEEFMHDIAKEPDTRAVRYSFSLHKFTGRGLYVSNN